MKSVTGFLLLITVLAMPVHAGQGTIEETETAIIVEYTGDASDRPVESAQPETSAAKPKSQPVELQAASTEAANLPPDKKDMSVREAKTNRNEVQRQKLESRAVARTARQPSRQNQQEPE